MSKDGLLSGFKSRDGTHFCDNGEMVEVLNDGAATAHHVDYHVFRAIEEHALAKRGLWEASNGHLVLRGDEPHDIEGLGRTILVINPAEMSYWTYREHDEADIWSPKKTEAAQEYFNAHPEEKPWHNAKHGEIYRVTVIDEEGQDTYRAVVDDAVQTTPAVLLFRDIFDMFPDIPLTDSSILEAVKELGSES